jgi:hypothetical protein
VAFEKLGVQLEVKGLNTFKSEMGQVKAAIGGTSTAADTAKPSFMQMAGAVAAGIFTYQTFIKVLEKVAEYMRESVAAAAANETAMMHLNTTLASSGRNAEISAKQIAKMATGLMEMSSFDDEAIIDAYNAMAKFETINTGDLDKVVKTAMDMTVALGGDLATNANEIARVLETGLIPRSWGFTAALKEQIKNLIGAGESGKALTLILDQLNSRYGGQAAAELNTYAGKVKQLEVALGELKESVGRLVLPVLKDLVYELLKVAKTADLIVNWNEKITNALKEHGAEVLKTSKSYDEYAFEMMRSTFASKGFTDEIARRAAKVEMEIYSLEELAKRYGFLTEAQRENMIVAKAMEVTDNELAAGWRKNREGFVPALESEKKAMVDWASELNLALSVAKEYGDYTKKLADLEKQLADARAAGYGDTSEKVVDLKTRIEELQAAHKRATDEMLLGLIQYQLALDGLSEADIQWLLNLRLNMGLLTQAEYDAAMGLLKLRAVFDAMPKEWSTEYKIYYITYYETHGTPPPSGGGPPDSYTDYNPAKDPPKKPKSGNTSGYGYAQGGVFTVPPGFNRDNYIARFTSGELVMAFTKAQQRAISAPMRAMNQSTSTRNVNYNYNPTYGSTPNNPSFDFAVMQARGEA